MPSTVENSESTVEASASISEILTDHSMHIDEKEEAAKLQNTTGEAGESISREEVQILTEYSVNIDDRETAAKLPNATGEAREGQISTDYSMHIDDKETETELQNTTNSEVDEHLQKGGPDGSNKIIDTNKQNQIKAAEIQTESLHDDNINPEKLVKECNNVMKSKGKHKTGFNEGWKENYPWLKAENINEKEVLFCTLCTKWLKNSSHSNSPWIKSGYLTLRLDKVREHGNSHMHKKAVSFEANQNLKGGCVEKDLDLEINSELSLAVESAMKCMKFLIKHNLPHHSLFEPFIDFCIQELKSPVLLPLNKAKNCKYRSHRIIDEFLEVMAETKEEEVLNDINNSPCFSVLADESSDNTNRKHMAVAVKYLKDGYPKVSFVRDCRLGDGKSESILTELMPVIDECGGLPKITGFTSDGARAMIGNKEGVATKLKEKKEDIITMNCMNHRLALASKDGFQSQSRFMKLDEIMTSTYKYYKYSSSRTNSLMNAQSLFCGVKGSTTLKRVGFTRWLSHQKAVDSIRRNYPAILNDLENAVSSGASTNVSGPSANALLKNYKSFDFFQGIHFLCDVLNEVAKLNLSLQAADADITTIVPNLENTLSNLRRLKKKPGGTFCRNLAEKARSLGIIAPIAENKSFETDARKFLDQLIENIEERMENSDIIAHLGILDLRQVVNKQIDILAYGNAEIIELAEYFKLSKK